MIKRIARRFSAAYRAFIQPPELDCTLCEPELRAMILEAKAFWTYTDPELKATVKWEEYGQAEFLYLMMKYFENLMSMVQLGCSPDRLRWNLAGLIYYSSQWAKYHGELGVK